MKWGLLVLLITSSCWAMTPILNDYPDGGSVFTEMRNIFDNAQDQSFNIVSSTPTFDEFKDGQMMVYKSSNNATDVNLMLRAGTTVYISPNFRIIQGR